MPFRATTAPAQNLGYFRATDWPSVEGAGPVLAGGPTPPPGQNGGASLSDWHPTVKWMLGFVVAELVAFHLLSRFLKI